MSIEIKVPALGESVSEATIAKWYKKAGDVVKLDELILELETEKVTLEVNAAAAGIVEEIRKSEGEIVKVGEVVGKINPDSVLLTPTSTKLPKITGNNQQGKTDADLILPPSVQKMVKEHNINPYDVQGTGKNGRITKEDLIKLLNNRSAISPEINEQGKQTLRGTEQPLRELNITELSSQEQQEQSIPNQAWGKVSNQEHLVERVKISRLRKTIAERLKESQNTAAILTTFNEIDMSRVIALKSKYRDGLQQKYGIKPGFMSFFVKAVVRALQQIPSVNAEIDNDYIIYKKYYDIGVAVGTEQGLVVPVLKGSDRLGLLEIEKEIAGMAIKARAGKLSMDDLSGGTFTITNGGIYGSLLSTPIINPPQVGIIGLHNIQERPVAVEGKVEIRPMMYVALSYDHRLVDGKDAVTFLVKVKEVIENPDILLFDL